MHSCRLIAATLLLVPTFLSTHAPYASAQDSDAAFFKGKTLNVFIGSGPGGGYDLYGRLVARYIGEEIPGNPTVVAQNRPGASGFVMSQWLYAVAPKDGLNIGTVPQNAPTQEVLGNRAARFESAKFLWIGRLNSNIPAHYVWHTSPIKTIQDVQQHELLTGADTPTSTQTINPRVLNLIAGTKFHIVNGYGTSANVRLAVESGEVQAGIAPLSLIKSEMSSWLKQGTIRVIVQYGPERHASMPDVPASVELGRTEDERNILKFFVADSAIGRAVAAPPNVPMSRINTLRRAFDAMIKDPAFIEDTKKRNIEIDPMSGEKLQAVVASIVSISPETLNKARDVAGRAMQEAAHP